LRFGGGAAVKTDEKWAGLVNLAQPPVLEHREELVGARLDDVAVIPQRGVPQHGPDPLEQVAVAVAEAADQRRRFLDVGEQHRHEARRQTDRFVAPAPQVALRPQLVGDEPDGHDRELLGRVELPLARTVAGRRRPRTRPG
jgi:hypothetical protein